jgi:hypothetical protein
VDGQWVCLTISSSFHHGDKDAVVSEIQGVFGDDLFEARIVCDDVMEQTGEYFTLVKCSNYFDHMDSLKGSAAVLSVVPSYGEPAFLSKAEVDGFSQSVDEEPPPSDLIYGDIVRVTSDVRPSHLQFLAGLHGIVVKFGGRTNWVFVFFRFETRCFEYAISSTSLDFIGNVLETMAVPPFKRTVKRHNLFSKSYRVKAREAVGNLVSRDKIRRRQRRIHERPYSRR